MSCNLSNEETRNQTTSNPLLKVQQKKSLRELEQQGNPCPSFCGKRDITPWPRAEYLQKPILDQTCKMFGSWDPGSFFSTPPPTMGCHPRLTSNTMVMVVRMVQFVNKR